MGIKGECGRYMWYVRLNFISWGLVDNKLGRMIFLNCNTLGIIRAYQTLRFRGHFFSLCVRPGHKSKWDNPGRCKDNPQRNEAENLSDLYEWLVVAL